MAQKIGCAVSSIQNYESGTLPKGDYLKLLSKALGCSLHWLVLGEGPEDIELLSTTTSVDTTDSQVPTDDLSSAITMLAKIYSSKEQILIRAINSNLHAFTEAVENKQKAATAAKEVNQLKTSISDTNLRLAEMERKLDLITARNTELATKLEEKDNDQDDKPRAAANG